MQTTSRVRALALLGAVGLAAGSAGCSRHGHPDHHHHGPGTRPPAPGPALTPLTDLQPASAQPTDGAKAGYRVSTKGDGTTVVLHVAGFAEDAAGQTFGAHVHTGPCVAGDGAAAGPHFSAGQPPSKTTEVWLDVTIDDDGDGTATATVPFAIPAGGAQSIVIHEKPTAADGTAGARFACIPFSSGAAPRPTTTTATPTTAPTGTPTTAPRPVTTAPRPTTTAPRPTTTMAMGGGEHGNHDH